MVLQGCYIICQRTFHAFQLANRDSRCSWLSTACKQENWRDRMPSTATSLVWGKRGLDPALLYAAYVYMALSAFHSFDSTR